MPNDLNRFFSALSDSTRRAVIEHLARGPTSVKDLHAPHKMALPTFMRHLKVLEDSGLIRSVKTFSLPKSHHTGLIFHKQERSHLRRIDAAHAPQIR